MIPSKVKGYSITVRVSKTDRETLDAISKDRGVNCSELVRSLIEDECERWRRKNKKTNTRFVKRNIDENGKFTIDGETDVDYNLMRKMDAIDGRIEYEAGNPGESSLLYWIDGEQFAVIEENLTADLMEDRPDVQPFVRTIKVKIIDRTNAIKWLRLLGRSKEAVEQKLKEIEEKAKLVQTKKKDDIDVLQK